MPANLENSAVATRLEKVSFILIPNKGDDKECLNYHTIALISHASKMTSKSFKLSFNSTWRQRTRNQIANFSRIIEKAREFQKNIYLCFIDYAKAFVWIITNCGKLLKRWEYQTILPVSWETCVQVKKQQLEPCMEHLIGSRLRKA